MIWLTLYDVWLHAVISNHWQLNWLSNSLFGDTKTKSPKFALLAYERQIHRWPVDSNLIGQIMQKVLPGYDIVINKIAE